jgi:hypothetical protein
VPLSILQQGPGTEKIALEEAIRIKSQLFESKIKFHQFEGPTQVLEFLGAVINTREMTVAITKERIVFMRAHIKEWKEKQSYTLKELSSLIGLLLYLAQIVKSVKSTTAWLIQKKTNMSRSTTTQAKRSSRLLFALNRDYILAGWNGIADIYDMTWSTGPDLTVICDVAIDIPFPKAGSFGKGAYTMPEGKWVASPWTTEEAEEGKRELSTSSTHLELANMLESVVYFAKSKQKVLCITDNLSSFIIARDRYSKVANSRLIERIQEFDLECLRRNLSVRFQWLDREESLMKMADALSRNQV